MIRTGRGAAMILGFGAAITRTGGGTFGRGAAMMRTGGGAIRASCGGAGMILTAAGASMIGTFGAASLRTLASRAFTGGAPLSQLASRLEPTITTV